MEVFAAIVVLGIFFSPLIALLILRKRLKHLDLKVKTLQDRLESLEALSLSSVKITPPSGMEQEPAPVSSIQTDPTPPGAVLPPSASGAVKEKSGIKPLLPLLGRLEWQFLNNWTGLLGAVIVVLGAGFLGIYAALKVTEFYRFLLLLLLSALPAGLFVFLRGRDKWIRQAGWMLSISGAIFLFACLGSGGIPGLQWIDNSYASLGLLILGVGVNLGLGSLGKKQSFASFHTLLSLVALAVVPPGTPTLFMAVVICLYAVLQTYAERWDLHILLTITGFFLYHLFWIFTLRHEFNYELLRIQGVVAVTLVFSSAALIHYRKNYASGNFELFPFLVHLVNWSYFTVGMILYLGEYQWRTIPLIMGALAAFLLADRAHRRGIIWLKTTDVMICQVLTLAAFVTLLGWHVEAVLIGGLIFAESVLFIRIMVTQKNYLLYRVGVSLSYLASLVLMLLCIKNPGYSPAIIMAGAIMLSLILHRSLVKLTLTREADSKWLIGDTLPWITHRGREFSLTGFSAGLQGVTLIISLKSMILPPGVFMSALPLSLAVPLLVLLLFSLSRHTSKGLLAGALLFLGVFSLAAWNELWQTRPVFDHVMTGLSLLTAGMASVYWLKIPGSGNSLRLAGIIMLTLSLVFLSHALLDPVSPFLPALFWLASALFLLLTTALPGDMRYMVFLLISAFLIRHFTVHLKLDTAWGFIKLRYLMELMVLPVFHIWYRGRDKSLPHFYVMETGLFFITVTLLIEISLPWISVALGVLAFLSLLSRSGREEPSRILFYSLILNWAAIGALGAAFFQRHNLPVFPWSGSLAVLINLGYIILFVRTNSLKKLILPPFLFPFTKLAALLDRRIYGLLLYPLTLGTALFIFGSFPAGTLTLLWALECFLIFSASIFLGEEHFRHVSQGGLFLCVIRLVLVDLSGSTPLSRGMVFLGVGILMLGVNVLYNRFKDRFIKKS